MDSVQKVAGYVQLAASYTGLSSPSTQPISSVLEPPALEEVVNVPEERASSSMSSDSYLTLPEVCLAFIHIT